MTDPNQPDNRIARLLLVLAKHRDLLAASGSDETLLKNFSALLKFLRSAKPEERNRIFFSSPKTVKKPLQAHPEFSDEEISNMPVERLEKLINEPAIPRKFLERIAIHRFKVPRGSMRSFSNRRILLDKLATLIRNEQTHRAIDTVARS